MGSSGKMPAARLGDIASNHGPWPPTPIIAGSGNVLINGIPAARKGDAVLLHVIPNNPPHPRSISEGVGSVKINGIPAARVSDAISCGGKVAVGSGNVLIGDKPEKARNAKVQLEFEELINKSISDPKVRQYTPHQKAQLSADIAVKYRGEQGAVDTWHDFYMSNNPTTAPTSAAEAKGLKNAQQEKVQEARDAERVAKQVSDNDQLTDTLQPLTDAMVQTVNAHPKDELPSAAMEALTDQILETAAASNPEMAQSIEAGEAIASTASAVQDNGIDESAQVTAKKVAAAAGVPFCEECAKASKASVTGKESASPDSGNVDDAGSQLASVEDEETKPPPAKTIEEAVQRLSDANAAIEVAKANGEPLPTSPFSLEDKQKIVENGLEENILVRVIKTDHAKDDGKIARETNGKQVFFTAPFSQVEHGDSQAKELLNAFGTNYDPDATYTMLVIDRSKLSELGDTESIIPTFDNLNQMIADNPEIGVDADVAKQVLNAEFAPKYEEFSKAAEADGVDLDDPMDAKLLADTMGFSDEETHLLQERHAIAGKISAWDIFQGNGMTRDTNFDYPVDGPVEVFTFDRKPLDLGDLESQSALTRIELS